MMNLQGKNVLFVAGLGGIAQDLNHELVKRNLANLILLDKANNPEYIKDLQALNPKVNISFFPYDVTVPIEETRKVLKKVFDQVKTIDLLINGAGIVDEHQIDLVVDINLKGLINTSTAIVEFWDKRKGGPGGVICNIGSVSGLNGLAQIATYSATKAGVVSFSRSLAALAPITGVTAYSVNPGITITPLVHHFNSWLDVEPGAAQRYLTFPTQTGPECAESFIKAIEINKNGAIWKLDQGNLEALQWPQFWHSGI